MTVDSGRSPNAAVALIAAASAHVSELLDHASAMRANKDWNNSADANQWLEEAAVNAEHAADTIYNLVEAFAARSSQ